MHPKLESLSKTSSTAVLNVVVASASTNICTLCAFGISVKNALMPGIESEISAGIAGVTSVTAFGPGLPLTGLKLTARSSPAVETQQYEVAFVGYALARFVNVWRQVRNNTGIVENLLRQHEK